VKTCLLSGMIEEEPTGWPMPQCDAIVIRMKNSKYFIKLDLFKGFWLLPLAEECREQFSFMTPDGVFTQ